MHSRLRHCVMCSLLVVMMAAPARPQNIGEVLPPWNPGTLDIHQISTGRGNAALFIFPDGTTMLVDAGAQAGTNPRWVAPRPDDSRTPGDWITRYVLHTLEHDPPARLDYVLLTHFHSDHMGQFSKSAKLSKSGQYRLTGITEVGENIPIGKLMDRGWPDYLYPAPLGEPMMKNYRAFVQWQSERSGMRIERFRPGRNDQITSLRHPEAYPNFEVRNIMANGEVWTGVGTVTREQFPVLKNVATGDWPTENMCSAGIRLSYGKFDYYSGGDIPGIPF